MKNLEFLIEGFHKIPYKNKERLDFFKEDFEENFEKVMFLNGVFYRSVGKTYNCLKMAKKLKGLYISDSKRQINCVLANNRKEKFLWSDSGYYFENGKNTFSLILHEGSFYNIANLIDSKARGRYTHIILDLNVTLRDFLLIQSNIKKLRELGYIVSGIVFSENAELIY